MQRYLLYGWWLWYLCCMKQTAFDQVIGRLTTGEQTYLWFNTLIIPPEQQSCLGVYWFHSVRPSVRLSRLPCPLCNIYSSGWILSILATNDHYHVRVCRTQWPLTLTYIFRVIWPWLENRVCSVAFTVLDGFFWYLAQMITIIRGCVACYVLFRIWKWEGVSHTMTFDLDLYLQGHLALTWKSCPLCSVYSSGWILLIFGTNDHYH